MTPLNKIHNNQDLFKKVVFLYPKNQAYIAGKRLIPEININPSLIGASLLQFLIGFLSLFIIIIILVFEVVYKSPQNIPAILVGLILPFSLFVGGVSNLQEYNYGKHILTKATHIVLGTAKIIVYRKGRRYIRYKFEDPNSGKMIHSLCHFDPRISPEIDYGETVAILYADHNLHTLL